MKKQDKSANRPLAIALGTGIVLSLSSTTIAQAEDGNPFAAIQLSQGYMLAEHMDGHDEAKNTEGRCGSDKDAKDGDKTGKDDCDDADEKTTEGKCGSDKESTDADKSSEGKCGEGKCGEGKCGGDN